MLLVPYLDRFKASSHSVTFGKRSCRPRQTAAGAPAAPAPPGEAAGACRPNQAPAATGNSHRKSCRVGRSGGGERRETSPFLRWRTGTRARPGASQHPTGAAAARAQAGDRLTGPRKCQKVSEAARRSPSSAHAGAGVPMTAAEDRLRLCCRDGWSVHTCALPAPRCWPSKQDGLTQPWRNSSRVHRAHTMAFRACRLMNLTVTTGLISPDLQKYLKETGSAETYRRQGTAGLRPPPYPSDLALAEGRANPVSLSGS